MKFDILGTQVNDYVVTTRRFIYDNMTSEIFDHEGTPILINPIKPEDKRDYTNKPKAKTTSIETPVGKSSDVRILKIQLGLSCNYACEYCSQRFVPTADETSSKHIEKFISNLDLWITKPPVWVEFWGGEPLAYIKTLMPLAEAIRAKWPDVKLKMITNGSLLTPEINDWIEKIDFHCGISHDGPGQVIRGPDPLFDKKARKGILDLYYRLQPKGKISFNSMIHRENMDRRKILDYFEELIGEDFVRSIGEGSFIDAYDEGGKKNSLQNRDDHLAFRRLTMDQLRSGQIQKFNVVRERLNEWVNSFANHRPADVLGQKCGMDNEYMIAVDLRGNVLTCQNVSAVSSAPNGLSHMIGHVSRLEEVKLKTATHWSFREECVKCPLLQGCKGSCMFLKDELFKISCDNAYSDHLPFFAGAFEMATGYLPFAIVPHDKNDRSLPEDRADLWGPANYRVQVPEVRKNEQPNETV
jgi:uncharacterized protein